MTLAADRDAIVVVLGGVDGLSPSRTVPAPIVAGSCWPVWQDMQWVTISQTLTRWQVWVVLSNADASTAVEAADQIVQEVAFALMGIGKVGPAEPVQWAVEPGQQAVPAVRFGLEI
jgi:hypothetical protein